MNLITYLPSIILILNIIFIILLIFFERRDPTATWGWLLILTLIPILGFVLYLFLGLTPRKRKIFRKKQFLDEQKNMPSQRKKELLAEIELNFERLEKSIIRLGFEAKTTALVGYNDLKIYTNGTDKFADLFADLEKAENFIHANYYIIQDDQLGDKFINLLTKKAAEGIEVRLLYDKMGCRNLSAHSLNMLEDAGGKAAPFAPFILDMNYRNHRKNVVIDGKIGYLGGINVGEEYIGHSRKFADWRDTHLRLVGKSVDSLQHQFSLDWNFAVGEALFSNEKYFPEKKAGGSSPIQIVSSGPDSEEQEIKSMFLKMIYGAEKNISIQSPYFIPDQSVLEALKNAARSGIDVKIMIPDRGDHAFVYGANNSFIGHMLESGARCYRYKEGFLHSKTISIDGRILSIGTTNMDVRSFKLNFEINAFIYDKEVTKQHDKIFEQDLEHAQEITMDDYENRGWTMKVRESISRLLSPIL
jgi:cardiolipin synthase